MDAVAPSNAVAGPSNARSQTPTTSADSLWPAGLYLPPLGPPPNQVFFTSAEDLVGVFHLQDAYDKYVRPMTMAGGESGSTQDPVTPAAETKPDVKGKGKEIPPPPSPGGDDDDEDGGKKGDKKKKNNNYRHLIRNVPGKHSMRKDDYLTEIMQQPPKQRVKLATFDLRTQSEAFTVSAGGIPNYNAKAIVKESPQAREDRKRNREARRAAQAMALSATNIQTPNGQFAQTPGSVPKAANAITATRPGLTPTRPIPSTRPSQTTVPRPGSTKPPLPPVQTSTRVATPGNKVSTPHPLSAPPLSASALTADDAPFTPGGSIPPDKRGKKREREDANGQPNGAIPSATLPPTNINGTSRPAMINAKAGNAGVRPRPVKKQRVDMQGQAREMTPVQQPTPQGV